MDDELKIEFIILFGFVAVVIIICLVKGMTTEAHKHISTTTVENNHQKDPTLCTIIGCNNKRKTGGEYCVSHSCKQKDCTSREEKYRFCASHRCSEEDCGNLRAEDTNICLSHKRAKAKKEEEDAKALEEFMKYYKSKYGDNKTSGTYKPKRAMPDCDDYDSLDDFLDDWDGYMPDGSDALDYWENW